MDWRDKLEAWVENSGRTRASICRSAGVGPTALRDILDRRQSPSVDQLTKLVHELGKSITDLYGEAESISLNLRINGVTSGEPGVWSEVPRRESRYFPLNFLDQDAVTIEVSSDDLKPDFRHGDIISGPKIVGPHVDNYAGQECIVVTKAGDHHICILLRGTKPGRFNLRPLDNRRDEIKNVEISWIAPVQAIFRARS
jgi:transcriptional regulator with XRE-family HTH domain